MIRTRAAAFFTISFSVALLLSLLNVHALGQAPSLGTIPNEIKNNSNVAPHQATINQFITAAATQLSSESADAQTKARESLVREALVNGQPTASPAYLNLYTQLLNQQLLNLSKSPNMRVRLNAAIITYSVARVANLANLAPAAIAFINDASPAVVLWGVKAGRPLVAAQLRIIGGGGPNIANAVVAAAKKHSRGTIGGAVAVDAYDALTLEVATAKNVTPQMISAVIPLVHDLMAFRVAEFRRGIPPEPGADRVGASFLVHSAVWPVQTPQQRATTMQLLSDLLSLAAAQAVPAGPADANYLVTVIRHIASSIQVAASNSAEPGIVAAVRAIPEAPRGTGAAQMAQLVKTVHPAIQGSANYAKTTPPPTVTGNEPPPPPASAPTTGPVAIPGASGAVPPPAGAAGAGAATPPAAGTATPTPPTAPRPATPPPATQPRR